MSDKGPQFISHVWRALCDDFEATVFSHLVSTDNVMDSQSVQIKRWKSVFHVSLKIIQPICAFCYHGWKTHNTLTSSAMGWFPYESSLGYHPPLLRLLEPEISVSFIQHHIKRCKKIWRDTKQLCCELLIRIRDLLTVKGHLFLHVTYLNNMVILVQEADP